MADLKPPPNPKVNPQHFAVAVEINGSRNQSLIVPWDSAEKPYRGRWSRANTANMGAEELGNMPDVPGLVIVLNTQKRQITVTDPLRDPANEKLLNKLKSSFQRIFKTNDKFVPEKTKVFNLPEDDIKTAALWLLGQHDLGSLKLIKGTIPTFEQIKTLPGYFLKNRGSTDPDLRKQFANDEVRYVKPDTGEDDQFNMEAVPVPVVDVEGFDIPEPDSSMDI